MSDSYTKVGSHLIPKVLLQAKKEATMQILEKEKPSNEAWKKGPWDKGHWANRK